jgi:DNA-binding transcriptional ArsR family regulator
MVEQTLSLNLIFASLSDPTRRDILQRVADQELSVSEVAEPYDLTLAAISKHLGVLEKARLIIKRRKGKQQFVQASPVALRDADEYLRRYKSLWEERFDSLEEFLRKEQ